MHRRRRRRRVSARRDAARVRRAGPRAGRRQQAGRAGPDVRGRAAAGRRRGPHDRDGLVRRPAARHEGPQHRRQHQGAGGPGRAGPRDGRARAPDRRARPDPVRRAPRDPPAGAEVRRAVAVGRTARNRHQGHRPDLPVRQGRQDRPVRRRRRRQDRDDAGADQQHRDAALGPVGVCRGRRAHARGQRLLSRDVGRQGHRAGRPVEVEGGDGVRADERAAGQPAARGPDRA